MHAAHCDSALAVRRWRRRPRGGADGVGRRLRVLPDGQVDRCVAAAEGHTHVPARAALRRRREHERERSGRRLRAVSGGQRGRVGVGVGRGGLVREARLLAARAMLLLPARATILLAVC